MVNKASLRIAYGETLVELGRQNDNIVVLEADLGKSTMGTLFEEEFPERFFEMGIAEANMASVAAGLSFTGKIPFLASFAVFCTARCYDQIRTSICIPAANVKICGSSAGLSDFGDGSTHQSIEDIAIMRVLPNMQVFSPVDAVQTRQIIRYMANHSGPMYLRVNRNDLPILSDESVEFVPGQIYSVREGRDAVIFASGVMVSKALEAAEQLEREGIQVKVVNVPSIKPIDAKAVAKIASEVKGVVTAEEHSVMGGLGSVISECLAPLIPKKIIFVGIQDCFGTSAENYDVLLEKYDLTATRIVASVRESMKG